MTDNVNKPKHYTFGKFEVIDVLMDWFSTDPLMWQVGKYIARYMHKGKPLEDLKKARFYLDKRIAQLESTEATPLEKSVKASDETRKKLEEEYRKYMNEESRKRALDCSNCFICSKPVGSCLCYLGGLSRR